MPEARRIDVELERSSDPASPVRSADPLDLRGICAIL